MRKQEQEALRRLEAALMEPEHTDEIPMEEAEYPQDIWQDPADDSYDDGYAMEYDVYNTDVTDVDMEEYSEEVLRGGRNNSFLTVAMVFSLLLLAVAIFVLLKFLGVI